MLLRKRAFAHRKVLDPASLFAYCRTVLHNGIAWQRICATLSKECTARKLDFRLNPAHRSSGVRKQHSRDTAKSDSPIRSALVAMCRSILRCLGEYPFTRSVD